MRETAGMTREDLVRLAIVFGLSPCSGHDGIVPEA